MKNIFNLSVILLLAVFVTACNQNEELDNTPMEAGNELNVTLQPVTFRRLMQEHVLQRPVIRQLL